MRTSRLTFILLMASVICSACSTQGLVINNIDIGKSLSAIGHTSDALTELDETGEIILGQEIVTNLLGVAPLLPDQEVQSYVNKVGRWVSMHSERPNLPWSFAVMDDMSINAFAAPGGYVVITKGLLLRLNNEAELAGVLGHEISHVLRRHHLNALKKASGMSALTDITSVVLTAKEEDTQSLKLVTAGTEIYIRGLDKEDEFESDAMGVVLAARAGYDPYGLPAVLHSLQMINPDDAGMAMMFKTHPSLDDRLSRLDGVMARGFEQFDKSPAVESRFNRALANISSLTQ
ncbi:M48 family metalloprotease [Shewanella psychropiezotolerans]|uniref:M48 family metalloprotease n=1 Tax=Shewanella psychropiezotolerans TaxID=2593655 RepID=A0ABX5X523_9GAMM|nr:MULTISPECIES: M48 family metalloprotease [Shewanella]MPY23441.1 M48 family metalloprotease [Shewanella sp. YLB-07]QDO85522.1 M48 family metalloprotease [Shewanella psychropiezotolerans]